MSKLTAFLTFFILLGVHISFSQPFNKQDSLRGMVTPERAWWDLSYYHLSIKVNIEQQTIDGSNTIRYKVLNENNVMQIDLQPPMSITKVLQDGEELKYKREGNAYFVTIKKRQEVGAVNDLLISFSGKPRIAANPPWNSGLIWKQDSLGKPFVASVSWGAGSSQWWPCKDHMYDEVDSMKFSINVREDLVAVANGKLVNVKKLADNTKTYEWFVSNPINNYAINFNIGNYVNFSQTYNGEKGPLECNYFVLKQNLGKAKEQFKQVPLMLKAFEFWFGPYPFYEDSYKLVEVPYVGMEHQSATAYGNRFQNGYLGRDQSFTGWGKRFDYILVHESGHEWFASSITFKDIADIWIHESFTTYSEGLFVEYQYGKEAGYEYLRGLRKGIRNDKPMIGHYNVHDTLYTGDNYRKGATILHMLRQIINDDEKWRHILRGLNETFYHQTVTTSQIENFIAKQSGLDLKSFWDQYLRTTQIPVFEYYVAENTLFYHWTNCLREFDMPLKVMLNGKEEWIHPKVDWQQQKMPSNSVELTVDANYYTPVLFSNRKSSAKE